MTSQPRQFQGYVATRQEMPLDAPPAEVARNDLRAGATATNDAMRQRYGQATSGDVLAPVSNLSISSWYAISGTAMA